MKIVHLSPFSFASNTYLIISEGEAFVVDPSVSLKNIISTAKAENVAIKGIILTHGHFDHVMSLDVLRDELSVPAYIHEKDAEMLTDGRKNAFYEFYGKERSFKPADILLSDGDELPLGTEKVKVLHTPGHSLGSVCYDCGDFLITGDTLFRDTVGRCDLYGGNEAELVSSLSRLRSFDKNITIYPGHGQPATLGYALDSAAYYV